MNRPISDQLREIADALVTGRPDAPLNEAERLRLLARELDVMVNNFMAGFVRTVQQSITIEPRVLPAIGDVLAQWHHQQPATARWTDAELAENVVLLIAAAFPQKVTTPRVHVAARQPATRTD